MQIEQQPDRILKGVIHVSLAFFLFTMMQALNKLLVGQHHVAEIAFYRNLMALIPCLIYVIWTGRYMLLKTQRPGALAFRAAVGGIGLILTFGATQALPIANATVLFFAATLLSPAMAIIFLKEHVGIYRWSAVVVGLIGVFLVAQPSAVMNTIGIALALGAAVTHALAQVLIRSLKTESAFTITFYFFLGGAIIPGLFMPWVAHPISASSALLLLGVGITGGVGQYFLTTGFQSAPASLLAPLSYVGLLWATLLDVLIWSYVPGWPVFAGGAIIISANLFILYREQVNKGRTRPATDASLPPPGTPTG